MAVHAQYHAHAFPHDLRAITGSWPALDNATSASAAAFLVADPATAAGDLTCNGNNHDRGCLGARKRARVTMDLQTQQRALLPPVTVPVPQALASAGDVHVQSRALCSASASTSGRPPPSHGLLLSHLYCHSVEIDLLLRVETERLRAGLQDVRRRHARAAARRLRAAEACLERALARNAELDDRLRQAAAEAQAWRCVARSHEAVAAGLRATLDNLVQTQSPCAAGDAEDARSCCFEPEQEEGAEASGGRTRACRWCGAADACVLLLPCRHLCLCGGCEAVVEACPVCAATKNASLHVLLS